MNQTFMKEKKILPLVLSMSLPMVISMAVNSLYNIVDSYFVAQLSEDAMTALSLVYPVQNFITSVAVGFGIGINAAIALCLGAGDEKRASQAASQGLLLNILHGVILAVGCILLMPLFLSLFTERTDLAGMAVSYANIAFAFSPIITAGITYEKIFQAVGQMKLTMISMLCGCVANIVLDPLMIFGIGPFPRMEIEGAALATGIGQTLTLIIYLVFYSRSSWQVQIRRKYAGVDRKMAIRLYGVGIPATLNMALPSFLISALNGILVTFSESYVLVLGVYYKLQTFIYLSANGIVQGIRPLIGYNLGAGERGRVRKIYHGAPRRVASWLSARLWSRKIYQTALILSAAIMAVGTALCWLMPAQLFGLFTANETTISMGVTALHLISLGFIVSAVSVTSSGALEGMGKGTPSLVISLLRYVVVIIPAAFFMSMRLGAAGVWGAFPVAEIVTAVISWLIWRRYLEKR